jgi:hypothetical protein
VPDTHTPRIGPHRPAVSALAARVERVVVAPPLAMVEAPARSRRILDRDAAATGWRLLPASIRER